MRIAITGASGFVGSALVPSLREAGHDVVMLVRGEPADEAEIRWDPAAETIDRARLRGVDAVVHLAGEPLDRRWTKRVRNRLVTSRVDGTAFLARTLAALEPRPAVLVQASGIGFYGFDSNTVTEASPKGTGFVADLAESLEHAADPAREAGIRVVTLRKALVLGRQGGALKRMLLPFRFGLGGRVGSGRQSWSWVSLPDAVRAYRFAIESELEGPANVAAASATNAEFVKALGRAVHRRAIVPLPSFAVKLLFGQMGEEMLLGGQRVVSKRLTEAGFAFADTDLDRYLGELLRR